MVNAVFAQAKIPSTTKLTDIKAEIYNCAIIYLYISDAFNYTFIYVMQPLS